MKLRCANMTLDLHDPQVMGIVNVTPDSFSDGGRYLGRDVALRHALQLCDDGATLIDVGGESTRPGAEPVSVQEELDRVIPVIEAIHAEREVVISVDTSTPEVMIEAAKAGAGLINDVRALRRPGALEAALATGLPVCLMHMQGEPKTMQIAPQYQDVMAEVSAFLLAQRARCVAAGMRPETIVLDPGLGFGKSTAHNLILLSKLPELVTLGSPVLIGLSRKRFLGEVLGGAETDQRLFAGLAANLLAVERGARIIRVHDVRPHVDALALWRAQRDALASSK